MTYRDQLIRDMQPSNEVFVEDLGETIGIGPEEPMQALRFSNTKGEETVMFIHLN